MKNKILYFFITIFSIYGCDNYLDLVPEEDIETVESIFEKRSTALEFFSGCYRYYNDCGSLVNDPAMCATDEITTGDYMRNPTNSTHYMEGFRIAEGSQNSVNPILSIWGGDKNYYLAIRYANIFIDRVDDVFNMTQPEKEKYRALAKSIKALSYFDLLKRYGPIPLVPQNIDVEAPIEDMLTHRSPVDTVVNRIVELFDESIPYLEPSIIQRPEEKGFLTREAVYALKAKVLVYAASPLFNGNPWYAGFTNVNGEQLFSTSVDPEKWQRAATACDEAVEFCESQGMMLEDSHIQESTDLLNTIYDLQYSALPTVFESPELIWGTVNTEQIDIAAKLPRFNDEDPINYNAQILGCVNPTMRMVELFYTENGLPIDVDANWNYQNRYQNGIERDPAYTNVVSLNNEVLNLHLRREPRFYANIASDRCFWHRGDGFMQMNPYRDGDHGISNVVFNSQSVVNITGYWVKKLVARSNRGRRGTSLRPVSPFARFRLADLYLLQAEAWNEVSGPNEITFNAINTVRERAGIPTVQEAWNNNSTDPGRITTQGGLRGIIQQERMIELAFEGQRFWDIRRWGVAHIYMNEPVRGWNIAGTNNDSFYNNYQGPSVVSTRNSFTFPRDYFWPISDEQIIRANLVQNIGW